MENPLELPVAEEPVRRIHEFARDLAWGAANGEWRSALDFGVNTPAGANLSSLISVGSSLPIQFTE